MLEQQLTGSHKRIETVVQLEQQLVKYRQQIEEMSAVSFMLHSFNQSFWTLSVFLDRV